MQDVGHIPIFERCGVAGYVDGSFRLERPVHMSNMRIVEIRIADSEITARRFPQSPSTLMDSSYLSLE